MLKLPSKLGYGCYGLSGAYGNRLSKKDAIILLNQAYDLGIRYFDSAGSYGDTESILGEALNNKRRMIMISSKVSMNNIDANLTAQNIIQSCEKSLKKLQTDYIDLYQVHYDDPSTPIEETIEGFEKLKKVGKIINYGIGHLPKSKTDACLEKGHVNSVLAEMSVVTPFTKTL